MAGGEAGPSEGTDGQGSDSPVSSSGEMSVPVRSVAVQIFGLWDLGTGTK